MTERIQVIVEAQDAAGGVLRAITSQFGELGNIIQDLTSPTISWGDVTQQAVSLVINSVKNAVNETVKYVDQIRTLAQVGGQSVEETSRLVQVLDDYGLTAEDAMTATRALTKQGLAPNIDTLAKLSDEYLKINGSQAQNEFILKNLGRAGLEWVNVLKQGSAAIKEQSQNVNAALILNDEMVKSTIKYEVAQDTLNDTTHGWVIQLGTGVFPALTGVINHIQALTAVDQQLQSEGLIPGTRAWVERRFALLDATKAQLEEEQATRADILTKQKEQEVLQAVTVDYKGLIGSIQGMQRETDRYEQAQLDANAAIINANNDYKAGKIGIQEHDKILAESNKALKENANQHNEWAKQTVFSFLMARAAAEDGISEGEGKVLIAVGEQLGLFDKQTAEAMSAANSAFDNLDASNAYATIISLRKALEALTGQPYNITVGVNDTTGLLPNASTSGAHRNIIKPHASGGDVVAGSTYLVGERGAELFKAPSNGTVLPNDQMQFNYFYGPTSLVISGEGSDQLLGLRL